VATAISTLKGIGLCGQVIECDAFWEKSEKQFDQIAPRFTDQDLEPTSSEHASTTHQLGCEFCQMFS
jgi:hypothetical protein